MSAFALGDEQSAYLRQVRELATRELRPLESEHDAEPGGLNRPLLAALGEHGLLARLFGSDGRSAAALELCLLREALATISTEAETALALQALGSYPFMLFGTGAQVDRYGAGVIDGSLVAAFALSEAEAGSDAAALQLRAEPDGDGWRLTGEKTWISNAPDADVYTVFARTADTRARGITAFVLPGDAPGLSGERLRMLSPHAIGRLSFDGVRVGPDELIGEPDGGFKIAMRTLDVLRPSVGAFAVGMAQAALDAAIEHATHRQAFGGVLTDQQAVSHLLAEMATRVEASRLLVYAAAAAHDTAGVPAELLSRKAAMAKLFATESAQFVVDAAVQLHGARALQHGHLLERLYRDVRAPRIYEGASEVQRTIIGRSLVRAATRGEDAASEHRGSASE